MTTRRRITALAAAAVLAAIPSAAPAHGTGGACGGAWAESRECHLGFRGFPLLVYADATAPDGATASVVVRITMEGALEGEPLAQCEATGVGTVRCEAQEPSDRLLDLRQTGIPLLCHVEGASAGRYWCQSGSGL